MSIREQHALNLAERLRQWAHTNMNPTETAKAALEYLADEGWTPPKRWTVGDTPDIDNRILYREGQHVATFWQEPELAQRVCDWLNEVDT